MPRPPLDWVVLGMLPSLGVCQVKRAASHRQCINWIHENEGMLRNKYNMILVPGSKHPDRDWMLSMCRHFRKTGV